MGERLRAPAAKLFGKHEEEEAAGEEKIQSHLQSLRKVLAEFLEWRAADEKRRRDYLGNIPATRPAKPHTRSGPTARIPGRFGDERGRAAARRRRVRAAAPAAGREGARGAAAPGRARRCLRGRPSGKSLAAGRGDRAAPRPHRAAGGRAPAPGYREQPEQLERSEAAASPRAGKEPALLPPPARCPRGSSERTARPREIQTEAGNGENPEHGGKGFWQTEKACGGTRSRLRAESPGDARRRRRRRRREPWAARGPPRGGARGRWRRRRGSADSERDPASWDGPPPPRLTPLSQP